MLLGNTPFSSFRYIRCIVCVYRTLGFSSYTSCPCVQLMPVMLNHIHCVQVYAVNILLTRVYQTLISQSHTYWLGNGNSNPLRIHANQTNPQTMPQQIVFRFYFFFSRFRIQFIRVNCFVRVARTFFLLRPP